MDSIHQHSLITPTTCFTIACVAFSFLAVSAVWRNQNLSTQHERRRDAIPLQIEKRRPKAVRRRGVDSLYVGPGESIYSKLNSDPEPDGLATALEEDVLSELISLSAQLSQRFRAYQRSTGTPRITISSLLSELSHLTTNLCRLQQLHESGRVALSNKGCAVATCFEASSSSLRDTLSLLLSELSNPEQPSRDDAIHLALQQVRDQRPAIDFLLESATGLNLPPTPPRDPDVYDASQKTDATSASASSSSLLLLPPPPAPTGLTPTVDTKAWIEPPPEYSPPGPDCMHLLQQQKKGDSKPHLLTTAPEQEFAQPQSSSHDNSSAHELYHAITNNDLNAVVTLLTHNLNPNQTFGPLNRTPLHQAATLNQPTTISLLLRKGALPNLPDASGDTALHLAAWAGHVEALSRLLTHGPDIEIDYLSGRDGYSALWCAVSAYHLDAARLLLKHGARVSLRSEGSSSSGSGMQLLHQAAVTGQAAMCSLLLSRGGGALVDALDTENQTPLHYAAATGSLACCDVLLRAGASVNAKQDQGLTPAHWAAHKGHTEVLELLLEFGGDVVDAVAEESGSTPLHLGANRGHYGVVKLLLEQGGKRGGKAVWDGVEGTPAEMARAKGFGGLGKMIDSWRRS